MLKEDGPSPPRPKSLYANDQHIGWGQQKPVRSSKWKKKSSSSSGRDFKSQRPTGVRARPDSLTHRLFFTFLHLLFFFTSFSSPPFFFTSLRRATICHSLHQHTHTHTHTPASIRAATKTILGLAAFACSLHFHSNCWPSTGSLILLLSLSLSLSLSRCPILTVSFSFSAVSLEMCPLAD